MRGIRPLRRRRPLVRRPLSRRQRVGVAGAGALLGVLALGVVAGILLDRLIDFDETLDAGGEWDEGGGVFTRWY